MARRSLTRLRVRRRFWLDGREVRDGEPLLVDQRTAERLLAAGDVERDAADGDAERRALAALFRPRLRA